MTLQETLDCGIRMLKEQEIEDADLDAWLLLEFVTGYDRMHYIINKKEIVAPKQLSAYLEKIEQRANHIPLQYITGEQEFMGFPFYVNQNVLIPRQDTEVLVEEVLKLCQPKMRLLDVCTGSGCIAISLQKLARKATVHALDISDAALCVAKKNAERNDATVTWIQSDLFENIHDRFDIIVSNPPYIKTEVIKTLMQEVKEHEPVLALDGKEDGLFFYKKIIRESKSHLNSGGFLCFEIGYDQGSEVRNLMEVQGFSEVRVIKDLTGLDRVVIGKAEEY